MSDDRFETLLRSLPTRTLGAVREAELLAELVRAGAARRASYWQRPVRLWQAAAACAAVALLAVGATLRWRDGQDDGKSGSGMASAALPAVHTRIETALFAAHTPPLPRIELAAWQLLAATPKGDHP